jgi:hypothetical protein
MGARGDSRTSRSFLDTPNTDPRPRIAAVIERPDEEQQRKGHVEFVDIESVDRKR